MATYKVIQDIEAEDKLLGPLTLRQFIYAIIVVISGFIMFRLVLVNWFLALPFLPHTLFFALLAMPFGHDQSSEIWLLSKIRFYLKPRRRIWDQSGIQELVTITAPKKIEHALTNSLTQTEVSSRLQALADTIDSRGWSVKNVNVNLFSQPAYANVTSDRLIEASALPQEVSNTDINAFDDMLDEQTNPTAQNLNRMMVASAQAVKARAVQTMQTVGRQNQGNTTDSVGSVSQADYWFLSQNQTPLTPGQATVDTRVVTPGQSIPSAADPTPAEEALIEEIHEQHEHEKNSPAYGNMKTIQPLSEQPISTPPLAAPVTPTPDPAILELANNDDLNVATIARQANKKRKNEPPADEVVVSLR
jgi:hypothetical protein